MRKVFRRDVGKDEGPVAQAIEESESSKNTAEGRSAGSGGLKSGANDHII